MNGFTYNKEKKEIIIKDGLHSVIWKNVEENIGQEAIKILKEGNGVDDYLNKNNCKRFWGNN